MITDDNEQLAVILPDEIDRYSKKRGTENEGNYSCRWIRNETLSVD